MRLVRLLVTEENRDDVLDVLRGKEIDFVVTAGSEESPGSSLVEFPVPTDGLGDVLDATRGVGLDDDYLVVLTAENASTPHTEKLQDRYATDYDPLRLPELRSKARGLSLDWLSYAAMIFLSAIIAAAGLLIDSPAIVVGAMVIAPLVGPVLTTTVGAVTGDRAMLVDSVRIQALGLVAGVVGAVVFSFSVKIAGLVPSMLDIATIELIALRMAPSAFAVIVGFAAGAAAAFGLTTKGTGSLIGVMIAAALIPAAATVGIALAWGEYLIALGSALLLVSTMAAINLAMYGVLWGLYRNTDSSPALLTDRTPTRAAFATAALIVIAVGIAGVAAAQQATFQRAVTEDVEDVLDEPAYAELGVVSIRTQHGGTAPLSTPEAVTVILSAPNSSYPGLSGRLERRIEATTGNDVRVDVRFVTFQRSNASQMPSPSPTAVDGEHSSPRSTNR
ncbi:DUF389 domain-containing protein [Halococcus agarilyticus]|uniref:DUF389 domain-containing protein n=1 Tax=Halococcus agarilyticus TaxID=1232219 RepID=UPI0009AEF5B0|nr:DUF389 domain-containing protein [Halococcus agarilyticus]